jgi:hypothetical protein
MSTSTNHEDSAVVVVVARPNPEAPIEVKW